MKAVVFHGVGDIRVDDVPEPTLQERNDAIVRLTASAICGTDLHFVRGTMAGMKPGTILGHEGVGIVEQIGPNVRNLRRGEAAGQCRILRPHAERSQAGASCVSPGPPCWPPLPGDHDPEHDEPQP